MAEKQNIEYTLKNDAFVVIEIIDCITKHHEANDRLQWGLEKHLGMDLSPYYYFSVNTQNLDKKVIPGKAYVNGIKTEDVKGLCRGEYLIKKELIKEPLTIDIESISAYKIHFLDLEHCDHLALEDEITVVGISDSNFSLLCSDDEKPSFNFYKANTQEEIQLEQFKFTNNSIYPWMRFKMPPFDIDVKVVTKKDDNKALLIIDESSIKDIEYSSLVNHNIYFSGVISEALYSDDYDMGIDDHYFYEKAIHFKKGCDLTVIVYLLEKKNLLCSLNGINYEPSKVEKMELKGDNDIFVTAYEYIFKSVKFRKSGTLSFIIS